ncbi:hypothetical protein [Chroococcidiopsis sp. TS-821]|uniref:hypothetical protein n=1 Tax=Chroococcidiopsis sp. TS-821 TaxID=1378066 RepID=UPI000CEDBB4F|nr:hypothetical protein [Chroococcidiopsis sp. TS-821]
MRNQSFRLCFSVEDFFRSHNWEGELLEDVKQDDRYCLLSAWQCLSVENFFVASNWEGQIIARSQSTQSQQHWQCLSVNSFFSTCNWEGQSVRQNVLDQPNLWFTQKVGDFMQFISWEGKTEIGALPQWLAPKSMTVFEVAPTLSLTELF